MLIAKSGAYGCQEDALVLIKSYFTNKQRRAHVNSNFSMWEKIISRVLQGSILGTALFNIFLNDLLLFVEYCDLSKYANDSTLYTSGNILGQVEELLSQNSEIVTKWFYKYYMLLNSGKCHFMWLG